MRILNLIRSETTSINVYWMKKCYVEKKRANTYKQTSLKYAVYVIWMR